MSDPNNEQKAKLAKLMEEAKKKLTPEQMKQLMQMQSAMQGKNKPSGKFALFLSAVIKKMQGLIVNLDSFINFVVKKNDPNRPSVISATRSPIIFGVMVIFVFVGIGGIWSVTAPINSATVAVGTVIPVSSKQLIQAQISDGNAVIKEVFVRQGDNVIKGDKLIEFDQIRFKVQYEASLIEYRNVLASEARLIAQRDNLNTINFPKFLTDAIEIPEVAKIMEVQTNLFNSVREYYEAEKNKIKKEIARLQKDIEAIGQKKKALAKQDEVVKEKISNLRSLLKNGFAKKSDLVEMEAKEAEIVSQIAISDTQIIQSEQNITKQEIELLSVKNKQISSTLDELQKTQVQALKAKEGFSQAKDSLSKVILRSPVHGIVNVIYPMVNIGGVVNSGTQLMEITPLDDSLVIDARVPHKDIESVTVGLEAKIRFSAYKSRTTPLFSGRVISLSPDTVDDYNPSNDPRKPPRQEKFYIARISIDMQKFNEIAKNKKLSPLQPGMEAQVQIVTGTRTLLRYLMAPLADIVFSGFNEK